MPETVLDYWFGADRADALRNPARARLWWRKDPITDADIRARFEPLVIAALAGERDDWARTPAGLLALVILTDQFTRNIYRDTPQAFGGDPRALGWCRQALAEGIDRSLHPLERLFLYLPLEHSEVLADQEACIVLMEALVAAADPAARALLADALNCTRRHGEVISSLLKSCCGSHLLRCAVLAPSPIYLICLGRCAPCASQLAASRRFSTSC